MADSFIRFEAKDAQITTEFSSGGIDLVATLPDLSGYETADEVRFALAVSILREYIEGEDGDTLDGTLQAIRENLEGIRSPKEPMVVYTAATAFTVAVQEILSTMANYEIDDKVIGGLDMALEGLLSAEGPSCIDVINHVKEGKPYIVTTYPYPVHTLSSR